VVGGDAKSLSIAAASVVAKVLRDRRMTEMECAYPAYGFARHKGYGSREHIQALFEHGPCPEHRRSFRPVREAEAIRSLAPDDGDAHA
jgi:ribonuclease HII